MPGLTKEPYLARPGFPGLIEVQEKKKLGESPLFVEQVAVKFDSKLTSLVNVLGLEKLVKSTTGAPSLTIRGKKIELEKLF